MFAGIVPRLDFGLDMSNTRKPTWFTIMVTINLPKNITLQHLQVGIIPFVPLQILPLGFVMLFPQLVVWVRLHPQLPSLPLVPAGEGSGPGTTKGNILCPIRSGVPVS